jgi:hypothetical protein
MKINEASIFLGCEIDYSSERYLLVNLFSSLFLELQWGKPSHFCLYVEKFFIRFKGCKIDLFIIRELLLPPYYF